MNLPRLNIYVPVAANDNKEYASNGKKEKVTKVNIKPQSNTRIWYRGNT